MLLSKKQLKYAVPAFLELSNVSVTGSSKDVTSLLSTLLSTAGAGGSSVPLQVGSLITDTQGIITNAGLNLVSIKNALSEKAIFDKITGREVFARISESAGVYTISFFIKDDAGVETAYAFASATNIDIDFRYAFSVGMLPEGAVEDVDTYLKFSGSGATAKQYAEVLVATGTNALPNLTKTPSDGTLVIIEVNGQTLRSITGDFTVTGKAITLNPTTVGYDVDSTDKVVASYPTFE